MKKSILRVQHAMLFCFGACVYAAPAVKTHTMPCKYDSKRGASYDLSKLQDLSITKAVVVQDRMQVAEKDYVYTFGICTSVAPPPNCRKADGSSRVDPETAPGWQTNASQTKANTPDIKDRHCAYLGGNQFADDAKWALLDTENPGAGVTLTYTRGQHCSSGARRQLSLNFKCSKSSIEKIDQNVMDESAHCLYEINIDSYYACPTECGFGGGHGICNDHGVCGYDTDSKLARCFCNEGYAGPGCDLEQEAAGLQGYGPILGLLIFVTIAIVALVAAVVGLWRYMSARTMSVDGDSYARLDGDGASLSDAHSGFAPMRTEVNGEPAGNPGSL